MKKFMLLTTLVATVAATLAVAPALSASTFTGTCTSGTTTFDASFTTTGEGNASTLLFVTNTETGSFAGVLIPVAISLDGAAFVPTNPGIGVSTLSGVLTTCMFRTGRGLFTVTGILAPTVP